ncbi:MAG: hypothetical protein Q4A81_06245 [Pasteurellaceae bacterium]|nr:hypothetical protein [Pasteurellaceae bacterium]
MKKKILFVHPALVMGGAETVLISYLNILSKYSEKYEVDVAFIENRQNFNFDKIPNNINIHFILSDVESEFLICLDNRRSED